MKKINSSANATEVQIADIYSYEKELTGLSWQIKMLKHDLKNIHSICHVLNCCPDAGKEAKGIGSAELRQMINMINGISQKHIFLAI